MPDTNENKPISSEEYKKITEKMYGQNLELARLYKQVDNLNKQMESLMHLINHKVKGAFTHSKYIFVGLLDGTFGDVNEEVKKRAQQGLDSDDMGIKTIDLVLNANNLKKGTIKYDMKPVDFKEMTQSCIEEKKISAETKGLKVETDIKEGAYSVLGDVTWLKEAVKNLIENSIRYTKIGEIDIALQNVDGKIRFSVKDTGIGITDEDKKILFAEGGRGKDSIKTNVDSTGYGLYSVKLIVESHNGKVWGESEGEGKGSTFYIELPIAQK